jgi:hypothetical protein
MSKKFINNLLRDAPIYLNGYTTTYLFVISHISFTTTAMFLLAVISFF